MSTPSLVRVQTNHECLSDYAPIFADYESAVSWIGLVMGKLDPVAWLNFITVKSPEALGAAKEILKVCYGYAI